MKHLVSGKPEVVARWHEICDQADNDQKKWIAGLRSAGFKASHPNDGWVDREHNHLMFAYPQFNDGADVGDLVMLGWPTDKEEKLRPVRLTSLIEGMFITKYGFEDADK